VIEMQSIKQLHY